MKPGDELIVLLNRVSCHPLLFNPSNSSTRICVGKMSIGIRDAIGQLLLQSRAAVAMKMVYRTRFGQLDRKPILIQTITGSVVVPQLMSYVPGIGYIIFDLPSYSNCILSLHLFLKLLSCPVPRPEVRTKDRHMI